MESNAVSLLGKGWRTPLDLIKATALLKSAVQILIPLCTNYSEDHKNIALKAKGNKAQLLVADLIQGIGGLPSRGIKEIIATTAGEGYPDFPVIWAGIHPGVRDRPDAREQMALNFLALEDLVTRSLQARGVPAQMIPMEELFAPVLALAEERVKKAANAALGTAQKLKNMGKYGYAELGLEKIRQRVLANWVVYMATVIIIENRPGTIVLDPESHLFYWEGLIPFLKEIPPLFMPPHRQPLGY